MLAYFDCFSGISGDMCLGAMIDLGVPVKWLAESLHQIPLHGFELSSEPTFRMGIKGTQITVQDFDYISERAYKDIIALIEKSDLSYQVKTHSLKIFETLAKAEAHIHGCPVENVHFHEVGGIDAIADIVGTALCIEYLGITRIAASEIPMSKGFVSCAHGRLPLPAPATLEILKGVPVYDAKIAKELVTPTGAAIIKALSESFGIMPNMSIEKIGYGAGTRKLEDRPNLLRIIIGRSQPSCMQSDEIMIIETCIDDMNPEIFGFLMERLFEDGASDVYWIPIFMKKNRPGTMIQVLCSQDKKDKLINRILSETSSLGVRFYEAKRLILERKLVDVQTKFGNIQMKQAIMPDGTPRLIPEYEVCRKIALEKKMPLRQVYEALKFI